MNFGDFVWLFSSRFQSLWLLWWHKWHLFWLSSVSRWYNVIRWHDVISSLFSDPFGSTYRSKRDDTAVGKVTHSLLCTQLEPAISHAIRSHLRRCLSGSLCCTRLGPSPLPLPRLSIVRREQSVRSGGEHEFEFPVLACTTLYTLWTDWLSKCIRILVMFVLKLWGPI